MVVSVIHSIVVTHTPVLPVRSGSARRRWNTIAALSSLGPVDLLHVGHAGRTRAAQVDLPVERVIDVPGHRRRPSLLSRMGWMVYPKTPYEILEWDRSRTADQALPDSYDLAWYCRSIAHSLSPHIDAACRIVDLDDLEDEKLGTRRRLGEAAVRDRVVWARNTVAWAGNQRRLARAVDMVTLCSDDDRLRFGEPNCAVLPNALDAAAVPRLAGARPTILLIGLFTYEPNADAAEFLVREILPCIREAIPGVEVRLVGQGTERVASLAGPNVTVVGEVENLSDEYSRAGIVASPVRIGSGTRVKIIEAFAHQIPVVSTPIGAAGLGVEHGVHCLLAADPHDFATACVSLLSDTRLQETLIASATELHAERFSLAAFAQAVRGIVRGAGVDVHA
jgi:glycosyltransferase involved in cell wall biosynthesis